MLLLIALTYVRIKQRARVIIYYSIQSILEILSRTPSHTNLGSRLTNTYLRNIIIAKSFLPTLLHVYLSIYPTTLSSLNSCQPYFTDSISIHSVLLSSLSFLHELLYNLQFLTIKSYQHVYHILYMSLFIYLFIYFIIYLYYLLLLYYIILYL